VRHNLFTKGDTERFEENTYQVSQLVHE